MKRLMMKLSALSLVAFLALVGAPSAWGQGYPSSATGTYTVTRVGDRVIYTFTGTGTFTPATGLPVNSVLVVAGGGGGGGEYPYSGAGTEGGGGGAGGFVAQNNVSLAGGTPYTVTVGAGGAAGTSAAKGGNGANSLFGTITASGGGGAGSGAGAGGDLTDALSGGSGGGGGRYDGVYTGLAGAGTSGQGSAGVVAASGRGGGGGGAGAAGSAQNGGNGTASSITGTSVTYAGGGGAGVLSGYGSPGAGGAGGGGTGSSNGNGTAGTANTGGGGGGACNGSGTSYYVGGAGGSGIVIVSYQWPGIAANSTITASPSSLTADGTTTTTITVTAKDDNDNPISGIAAANVVVAATGSGNTLVQPTTATDANGQTTATLKSTVAEAKTVSVTISGTPITQTATVVFTPGAAAKLAFTTQPGGGTGGLAWAQQPVVKVQDALGNTITTAGDLITLAIGTNPGSGTLGCTTNPVTATSGVATFAGCEIDKVGTGYTLTAASGVLTGATSTAFNITVGAAAQLAFTTQPGGGTGGTAWTTQPVVTLQDAGGNTKTGISQNVTLAIQNNAGPGGTLSGTKTVAVNTTTGRATFAGLSIDKAGTGYTLTATGSTVNTTPGVVVSSGFNITTGPATKLAYTTVPSTGTAGTAFSVTVQSQDAGGNPSNLAIATTITLSKASGAGTLSGTLTGSIGIGANSVTISTPVYSNSDTMTLRATASGGVTLTAVTSGNIVFSAGAATKLAFTTQPGGGTGGTAWTTQPVVTVQDAFGNTVPTDNTSSVTLTITINPGGGTLTCSANPQTVTAGVATFVGCKIDKVGTGYVLTATDGSLTSVTSSAFNVTVGAAAQLAFTTQPGNSTGGVAFPAQPVVTLQDAGGNTKTGISQNVTLAIQNNAGPGGTLIGTKTVAVNTTTGRATFTGLSIDKAGTGYTLTATGSTVNTTPGVVVSSGFDITTGPATKLGFTTQPGGGTAGFAWAQQPVVALQDAGGNTVTGTAQNVTLAIQNNAGPGGVLSGTKVVAVNTTTGLATYSGLSIDKAGTGYTLTATGSTVNTTPGVVVSSAFNITAASFRSQASGDWATAGTWQVFDGTTWVAASAAPATTDNVVTIRTGHIVAVAANVSSDQVIVEAGGQVTVNTGVAWTIANGTGTDLDVYGTVSNAGTMAMTGAGVFESGGKYQHNQNGGTIPTATWDVASTVEVTGATTTAPGGVGQSFGNFTWNSTSQSGIISLNGGLTTVRGNFTLVSTGSGTLALGTNTTYTLNIGGDLIAQGGILDFGTSN